MYEPIRHQSVHTVREAPRHHNSGERTGAAGAGRAAQRREQLAGHLAALLAVTTELHRATATELEAAPGRARLAAHLSELESAARRITDRIGELTPTGPQLRLHPQPGAAVGGSLAELHARAHTLAGRVLMVAAAQQDTATAILACHRMDAHDTARRALRTA